MSRVFAAADIGSNTAHLLVARVGARGIDRLHNESEWLSLGQVVSHQGHIPSDLLERLLLALRAFRARARSLRAEGLYVFATEAMRRAKNHRSVMSRIEREIGVCVDLVSPRREAELGLKGALLDTHVSGPFVMVESGGGSVQCALSEGAEILQEVSLPLGTGVLIDRCRLSQPATGPQMARALAMLQAELDSLPGTPPGTQLIASGGVARGLWRALHPDGERRLYRYELEFLKETARRLNAKTIAARYSVKLKRAATLLPGSLVYLALMDRLGSDCMTVSEYGVREGAVLEMSQGKVAPCPL